jgi:serine O-acetyltransferase
VVGKITIGDDVLIAPNTFVNFDVPSHSVVVGSPGVIHHRDFATEGHLGIVKE